MIRNGTIRRLLIAAIGVATLAAGSARAQDWNVVLNGKAVHMGGYRHWNEDNWGVGLEREFDTQSRWVKVAVANGFRDSMDSMSYMAGAGVKRRFHPFAGNPGVYFDGGLVGFLMTREDVNDNRPFAGALPTTTFGIGRFALNLSYIPGSFVERSTNDAGVKGIVFAQLKLALPVGHGPRH